ncbi:MAG: hypothetical protein HUK40_03105 [Desulfobacter sp.]|nr:hypothetical protein [Desulfobacter sp.]WDP85224.1 MAG: hypothetical protein HUN05_08845 [Desulfobacter sp.]
MIICCDNGRQVDTSRLSPEERHIIQKLLAWNSLADSVAMFQEKIQAALAAGWNDSGPVARTPGLSLVIDHLEKKLRNRLIAGSG